jgi:protein-disulfide isomerase
LTAAQQLGVNSTPSFFINGQKFEGAPTFEAFDQLLSGLAAKS